MLEDFFNIKIIKNTKFYWVYIFALITTLVFWWILAIRIPIGKYLPYWFWQITIAPRPIWWLFLPLLMLSMVIILFMKRMSNRKTSIFILIIGGVIVQHAFGLMDGRGIDGIRDNTIITGHSAFAIEAIEAPSLFLIAHSYHNLIINKILPEYPNATKPPGQLLFYMLNERLSRFLPGDWDSPLQRLATFMTILWPILAGLPVISMYVLAKEIYQNAENYYLVSSLFYIFTPSVILIPLHLDQSLYPFLFIFTLTIFIFGLKRKNPLLFFVSGFATGIILFVSFSLLALPFYILLILLIKLGLELLTKDKTLKNNIAEIIRENIKIGFIYALGFLFLEILLFFYFGYNFIESYQFVMSNHFSSRVDNWSPQITFYLSTLNILEYVLWTGIPLIALLIHGAIRSFKKLSTRNSDLSVIMSVATPILFVVLALFGRNVGETARLWIFLTPLALIFSIKELVCIFRERTWHTVAFLIVVQMVTTFALKMWQDF